MSAAALALVLGLGSPGPAPVPVQFYGAARTIATEQVVARVEEIGAYCTWLGRGYETDCLADQYGQMRRWLPQDRAHAPLRAALAQAERDLAAVAARHRDPRAAPARAGRPGNPTALRAGREILPTLPAAAPAARAAIEATQTVLLRSARASDPRRAAFQRIAAALGTNKLILRS